MKTSEYEKRLTTTDQSGTPVPRLTDVNNFTMVLLWCPLSEMNCIFDTRSL